MKNEIKCKKPTKREAYMATIKQQMAEQQQLSKEISMAVLGKLTIKELKETIRLNEISLSALKELKKRPKQAIEMIKLGLSMITNI